MTTQQVSSGMVAEPAGKVTAMKPARLTTIITALIIFYIYVLGCSNTQLRKSESILDDIESIVEAGRKVIDAARVITGVVRGTETHIAEPQEETELEDESYGKSIAGDHDSHIDHNDTGAMSETKQSGDKSEE
jgi:hypothetical protein